ncbi:unnamed protein product [Heterobilharzia americana]|nr:unnamed protein product [Heterobilharzia americana]
MNDHSQLENSLKVFLQQLRTFSVSLPNDSSYAELRDSVNYTILQSKKCLKFNSSSFLKYRRDTPTPCSDIDIPSLPKDVCALSLPENHFIVGLLSDEHSCKTIHELEVEEIDEVILKLKQNELSKNFVRSGKKTSLHYAAYWASQTCVQTLVLQGSDLTARDEYGLTPIIWASESDQLTNLVVLLNAAKLQNIPEGQWIYDSSGYHLIHHALHKDDRFKCLEYLLNNEYGLSVDREGQSVLHHAAMKGFLNACKIILQSKSNTVLLNQTDRESRTPLHLATMNGHGNIVNLLLSQKANPHLCDKENYTSYQYANSKHLHFCLLIYERYNIKEKQTRKPEMNESQLNELMTFRPVNPQFCHYQSQPIEIITVNKTERQYSKPRSNLQIKPELLPTDKRVHRLRNPVVLNKQICQPTDTFKNSSVKLGNSTLLSPSRHFDIHHKQNKIGDETLRNGQQYVISNGDFNSSYRKSQQKRPYLYSKTEPMKDIVSKSRTSDNSSISDINSIPETDRPLMPTPCKIPSSHGPIINNSTFERHSRLLKRRQVNSLPQQISLSNSSINSSSESANSSSENHDEMIPLNLNKSIKQSTRFPCPNKSSTCNLLSPSLSQIPYQDVKFNENNYLLKK